MRPQMDLCTRRACAAMMTMGVGFTVAMTGVAGEPLGGLAEGAAAPPPPLSGTPEAAPSMPALTPVGLPSTTTVGSASTTFGAPAHSRLGVRRAQLNVLEDRATTIAGALSAAFHTASGLGRARVLRLVGLAGRVVTLQVSSGGRWRTVAHTRTASRGRYRLWYRPHHNQSERLRVRFGGDGADRGSSRLVGRLNVYRLAEASWYGGGGTMACGGALSSATMGVANKTLPCGTLVTLRYSGHTVRVPVVDRGPYVAGREFDLTEATRAALGFGDTGEVWSTR
jgi:rare lipoprotein A